MTFKYSLSTHGEQDLKKLKHLLKAKWKKKRNHSPRQKKTGAKIHSVGRRTKGRLGAVLKHGAQLWIDHILVEKILLRRPVLDIDTFPIAVMLHIVKIEIK